MKANRGFVLQRGERFLIDRRRKVSSLVPNEIILHEMQSFLREHFADRQGGRLLDVGAGLKPYEIVYAPYFAECVSVDHPHSQHAIEVDILASAESLPIDDETFDCVLCTEVLEHCGDPDAALSEMRRVLKPGGMIFLTTPFLVALHEMPHDFYRYTPSALELMAGAAGLEIESITTKGEFLAVLMSFGQFPVSKAWLALSKLLRVNLYDPRNPLVFLSIVWPQTLYLAAWRHLRRAPNGLLARIYRRLDYVTLGYVTVLRKPGAESAAPTA